ncbi:MAG: carbamoyltransferase HypF [Pseudomonadota bacterium]
MRIDITGAVQGVGFRPFLYRLAQKEGVNGAVWNTSSGVSAKLEGVSKRIECYLDRITLEAPAHADIWSMEMRPATPTGRQGFTIEDTNNTGALHASLLPDIAVCADCLADISDPLNRRYRYPFTSCTHCGPRYSILTALPYDRANTTMTDFEMCAPCQAEYQDAGDRRFHAQPIACPDCGPSLSLKNRDGQKLARYDEALNQTMEALRKGCIVALKGLGGYQLVCDAANDKAVAVLRQRKHRPRKPLAVMFPSLEAIEQECLLSQTERALIDGYEKPITLVHNRNTGALSEDLAPDNPTLGVMLPYTPLHWLLLQGFGRPLVATSGNLSSEPIAIDDDDARARLSCIADYFLTHNRPIARRVDDSVARIAAGRPLVLRRARGYAPALVKVKGTAPLVALGGHQKNTIAKTVGDMAYVSPHIGDLDTIEAHAAFEHALADFTSLHEGSRARFIIDNHDDYFPSQFAKRTGADLIRIQHHHAHVYAVMAEHGIDPPALGVAWDGAGAGKDGTVWGGEFFDISENAARRIAHLAPFPLPGGEAAMRDPRRAAFGLAVVAGEQYPAIVHKVTGLLAIDGKEQQLFTQMIRRKMNTPLTSSIGRLFDGVATLLDLCDHNSFEGEAAMALEFEAEKSETAYAYQIDIAVLGDGAPVQLNWTEMLAAIIADMDEKLSKATIARKFHNALADAIVAIASQARRQTVILSGGCFQNRLLLERTIARLKQTGFTPVWPKRLPPNDGGLSLGQIYGGMLEEKRRSAAKGGA